MKTWILTLFLVFSAGAWAVGPAQDAKKPAATEKKATADKADANKSGGGKPPGTMEKAGKSIKNGWKKLTHDVQQGAKKPACSDAQRSMNQCK